MAVIKKKNFLNIGPAKRALYWNLLRDEPFIHTKVTMSDLFGAAGILLRFSVSAHGIAEFLFGEDPLKV